MMPIKEPNNDQNIDRGYTKMSEDCSTQNNNAKLTDCVENINYLNNSDNKDDLNLSYDHMYASNTDNVDLNPADPNCQNTESEVKFLKEWLLMHLDLIQQQNDEILNKEKTILILKQENEMLKEHINRLDRGITFQANTLNNHTSRNYSCEETVEEMTQDAAHIEEDNKSALYFLEPHNSGMNNCAELPSYETNHEITTHDKEAIAENYSQPQNTSINCDTDSTVNVKKETSTGATENTTTSKPLSPISSPVNDSTNNSIVKLNNSNFVVNSSVEDTLKNLRMSIRRKRLCSSSSALSNNEGSIEEPRGSRKKKKRKGSVKDEKILTSNEQYVTQTGEVVLGIPVESDSADIPCATNLEVPRWRVKVYTSCYTMEGTENLDDEVYNKRHMRLENDERRRKRWDVQRIREQRIIEKLKQRQERIGSGSRTDDQSDPVQSLWPTLEDVKFLEVCDHLPVSAFGAPVPRFTPCEFSLPWLNNPNASLKKTSNRKSTIRRKATKR